MNYRLLLFGFLLFSCHKKDIVGPQGPPGPAGSQGTSSVLTGDIQGKVLLYDTAGNLLANDSGAVVSLDNTSPVQQGISGPDGSFTIASVLAGSYNLTIQMAGFGTTHIYNFVHSGTTSPSQTGVLELGQQLPSQYNVKELKVDSGTYGSTYYLTFTVILAEPQPVANPILIYFNDSSGVGNSANKYVFRASFTQQNDTTLVYQGFSYPLYDVSGNLYEANYLYMCAAIDNAKQLWYIDPYGNQVYPDAAQPSPQLIVNNVLHKY